MRKGLGAGMGKGYKNIVPIDSHIHKLSGKGIKTYSAKQLAKTFSDFNVIGIHTGKNLQDPKVKGFAIETKDEPYDRSNAIFDRIPEAKNVQAIRNGAKGHYYSVLFAKNNSEIAKDIAQKEGKSWEDLKTQEHFDYYTKAEQHHLNAKGEKTFDMDDFMLKDNKNVWSHKLNAKTKKKLNLKLPTVQVLSAKEFDTKFKDDYEDWEQGYATTKIAPDGTTNVYVRDDGDYSRDGKLLMHELKEIEIFKDLVNNKGVPENLADEMAHNMNPVKISGVSDQYPLNPNN